MYQDLYCFSLYSSYLTASSKSASREWMQWSVKATHQVNLQAGSECNDQWRPRTMHRLIPSGHMTFIQCHINVMTSHQRWCDVVSTLRAHWVWVLCYPHIRLILAQAWKSNDSVSGKWRPWSDCADAHAYQDLRCPHMPENMFSHGGSYMIIMSFLMKRTSSWQTLITEIGPEISTTAWCMYTACDNGHFFNWNVEIFFFFSSRKHMLWY